MTAPITIVSLDGHTQVPENEWAHYLEPRYHEYLTRLSDDNVRWTDVIIFSILVIVLVFFPSGLFGRAAPVAGAVNPSSASTSGWQFQRSAQPWPPSCRPR